MEAMTHTQDLLKCIGKGLNIAFICHVNTHQCKPSMVLMNLYHLLDNILPYQTVTYALDYHIVQFIKRW